MSTSFWQQGHALIYTLAQHGGQDRGIGEWVWEPSVIIGIDILVALYVYTITQLPRGNPSYRVSNQQVFLFLAGTSILFLALVPPLDVWSDDYLFSAHMVQHILLAAIVPMLWLLGTPGWMLSPLVKVGAIRALGRALVFPISAFLIFNLNFWLWHWPALYDLALADERIHIFQHLTFIFTGVLNWWPVLSPLAELPRISYPLQMIYLAANCQPAVVLGAILVFSRDVLYQTYEDAPRVFGISALTDQQIGGLTMWIPGNAIYLIALSVIFLRWMRREEPDQQSVRRPSR